MLTAPIVSETVEIGGDGHFDLGTLECRDINRSTILQRVRFDRTQNNLIVAVNGAYDRYCSVPPDTVDDLLAAPSMGQFFNRNIRRPASGDRYDCPTDKQG